MKTLSFIFAILTLIGCNNSVQNKVEKEEVLKSVKISYDDLEIEENTSSQITINSDEESKQEKLTLIKIENSDKLEAIFKIIKNDFPYEDEFLDHFENKIYAFKLKENISIVSFSVVYNYGNQMISKFKYMGITDDKNLLNHQLIGFLGSEENLDFETIKLEENSLLSFTVYEKTGNEETYSQNNLETQHFYKLTEDNKLTKEKRVVIQKLGL